MRLIWKLSCRRRSEAHVAVEVAPFFVLYTFLPSYLLDPKKTISRKINVLLLIIVLREYMNKSHDLGIQRKTWQKKSEILTILDGGAPSFRKRFSQKTATSIPYHAPQSHDFRWVCPSGSGENRVSNSFQRGGLSSVFTRYSPELSGRADVLKEKSVHRAA